MRTTLNLDPQAHAILKSRASRERKTIGDVISQLVLESVKPSAIEYRNGIPLLPNRKPGVVVTTEDIRELMDLEGI